METPQPTVFYGAPSSWPSFGRGEVSSKKILIVGIILSLISVGGGVIYALAFIYKKETAREAAVVLLAALLSFIGAMLLEAL